MDGFKMESPIDLRQTPEYADYMRSIGWQVEKVPDFLYIKKIPLLPWSMAKLQRVKNVDWQLVKRIRKKHRIIKLITQEMVAKKTIWVDLRKTEKQLLAAMKPKTRYNIRLAQRRGVKIFGMPQKWFEAQIKAFGGKCFAVLGYAGNELVAGDFFMTSCDGCFYSHNGSTETGRKLMAPSLCAWEGIREAKRRKLKVFDFEGIYDGSRTLRRWRGFTRFKRGFGGEEVSF